MGTNTAKEKEKEQEQEKENDKTARTYVAWMRDMSARICAEERAGRHASHARP